MSEPIEPSPTERVPTMVNLNLEKFPFETGETYLCRVSYTGDEGQDLEEWIVAFYNKGTWLMVCPNAECDGEPLDNFNLEILYTQKLPSRISE
jgi:hypothetical protein